MKLPLFYMVSSRDGESSVIFKQVGNRELGASYMKGFIKNEERLHLE